MKFIPIIILFSIASYQIYRAKFEELTPWKGGGFGMFSTVDSPGSRKAVLKAKLATDKEFEIHLSKTIRSKIKKVRANPTDEAMDSFLKQFSNDFSNKKIKAYRTIADKIIKVTSSDEVVNPLSFCPQELKLVIYKTNFNAKTSKVSSLKYVERSIKTSWCP